MAELLHCPIRGNVIAPERSADGLRYSEEKRRIDAIRFLLGKGYPASHIKIETTLLRFGHKGQNSFRTDLSVLDVPVSTVNSDLESTKAHIKLIAEIKRDNAASKLAKETQIYPALNFVQDVSALGLYWDDVEQRLFYRSLNGTRTVTHETAAALLPRWGQTIGVPRLTAGDLRTTNLLDLFKKIEDRLHPEVTDQSRRFVIVLQLLILKLYDEHIHHKPSLEMELQDFTDAPLGDNDIIRKFHAMLERAIDYYGRYLPDPVPRNFGLTGAMLRGISSLLAPVSILNAKRDVLQDFYMYFAKGVYRWDLGQFFTPIEVVDFIVSLVNPRPGDQIKDPACGSCDFLISSLHFGRDRGFDLGDAIWGADNSDNAVQVGVLNMVLNGDGKSHIASEDSLQLGAKDADKFSAILCNPPFGVRIVERRFEVLQHFDLGHEWEVYEDTFTKSSRVVRTQQTGLLFAELCVKQARAGGRIGIILPNGYLGNGSRVYSVFREWLLRHVRIVGLVAFPRFTFKKSGADVSASVLIAEKRQTPLAKARDSENYPFYVGVLESVGWSVGDNRAERVFKRDPETGAFLLNEVNEQIIDADFDRVLSDFLSSEAVNVFPWTLEGRNGGSGGWSARIANVLARSDLSLDPKRWCERVSRVRAQISAVEHFALGDVADVIATAGLPREKGELYRYIQIEYVNDGVVNPDKLRGWQLPDRAKHRAQVRDIFVGGIWGSVGKWFVAGGECRDIVVSNGFHRLRVKPERADRLLDIVAGINTEAYRIQARAFCTGSDGLAELSPENLLEIMLPVVTSSAGRTTLGDIVDALLSGRSTISSVVNGLQKSGDAPNFEITPRSGQFVQV